MAGQTVIPVGSPLAGKLYSRALFNDQTRRNGFTTRMIGPAPQQGKAERKSKMQTSAEFPFVRVTDLSKSFGDTISVDLFHEIGGKPVMGDKKIAGKLQSLTSDSMDISINQARHGVDTGGRMTQQRTLHNLRSLCRSKEVGWRARFEDQSMLVHAAGARGTDNTADWVIPLASDPDFADIMVNSVRAPTYNRHYFAGTATSLANLQTTDELALEDIDRLRAELDEMAFPMSPIKIPGDVGAEEDPLYCMYLTSRQWHMIQSNTSNQVWRTFVANALERSAGFKHPLFLGQRGMWNGILIKKLWRPIHFSAGSSVQQNDSSNTESAVSANVETDRALLFGAEALAIVHGKAQNSGTYYSWHEEMTDHGNTLEVSTASMDGRAKIRFEDTSGEQTDHGVLVMDSYAPVPA